MGTLDVLLSETVLRLFRYPQLWDVFPNAVQEDHPSAVGKLAWEEFR